MSRARAKTAFVWLLAGGSAAWALIRLLGLETGFPLVEMIAFTPYVAAASPIAVVVALLAGRRAAAALALAAAIALALAVLPRAFGGPTEAEGEPGPTLRVLAANMKVGKGDPSELVRLVDELDVDVLSVEELTPELAQALDRAGLGAALPVRELSANPGSFGGGLYLRFPATSASGAELPGGFPIVRAAVQPPGAPPLEIVSVHIQPPVRQGGSEWDDDLRSLPAAAQEPLRILLGDFNATLDHDEFRSLLDRGYADAAATLGDGLTPTWPEQRRFPPLLTIDHVLADERIGIRDYSTHEVDGSDHRAVFAELELPVG